MDMKPKYIGLLVLLLLYALFIETDFSTVNSHAAVGSIGFMAYSGASVKTCYVMSGQSGKAGNHESSKKFAPNKNMRTLTLGTKGFAQYSAASYGDQLYYDCRTQASETSPGASIHFRIFYDGDRSKTFPTNNKGILDLN